MWLSWSGCPGSPRLGLQEAVGGACAPLPCLPLSCIVSGTMGSEDIPEGLPFPGCSGGVAGGFVSPARQAGWGGGQAQQGGYRACRGSLGWAQCPPGRWGEWRGQERPPPGRAWLPSCQALLGSWCPQPTKRAPGEGEERARGRRLWLRLQDPQPARWTRAQLLLKRPPPRPHNRAALRLVAPGGSCPRLADRPSPAHSPSPPAAGVLCARRDPDAPPQGQHPAL